MALHWLSLNQSLATFSVTGWLAGLSPDYTRTWTDGDIMAELLYFNVMSQKMSPLSQKKHAGRQILALTV